MCSIWTYKHTNECLMGISAVEEHWEVCLLCELKLPLKVPASISKSQIQQVAELFCKHDNNLARKNICKPEKFQPFCIFMSKMWFNFPFDNILYMQRLDLLELGFFWAEFQPVKIWQKYKEHP